MATINLISCDPSVIGGKFLPHISQKIFNLLDTLTLARCRAVSSSWKTFVDTNTEFWNEVPIAVYLSTARRGRIDICQKIVKYGTHKNPSSQLGWTPLLFAARNGFLNICQLIINNIDDKNPADKSGDTPFTWLYKMDTWRFVSSS